MKPPIGGPRYNGRFAPPSAHIGYMDKYNQIENLIRQKYGKNATTRKAIGDFMLTDSHAINVKSNNIDKQNYSPNMISIKKMHEWVYEQRNELSFVFVDYREQEGKLEIIRESGLVPIEHIDWACLSIEAQGYGVIQLCRSLTTNPTQTKGQFYKGFLAGYDKYILKEAKKHANFSKKFVDPDTIDW